jgi:hypothetical protein
MSAAAKDGYVVEATALTVQGEVFAVAAFLLWCQLACSEGQW